MAGVCVFFVICIVKSNKDFNLTYSRIFLLLWFALFSLGMNFFYTRLSGIEEVIGYIRLCIVKV